jgi:hypothetical protein
MSRWLEAARAASMPVQLGQKGAVRSKFNPIGAEARELSATRDLTDPNRPNCTGIETETQIIGAAVESPEIPICGQCAIIVNEGQEFLNIVADGFGGVIHLDCYDAWFDAHIRGRYPG